MTSPEPGTGQLDLLGVPLETVLLSLVGIPDVLTLGRFTVFKNPQSPADLFQREDFIDLRTIKRFRGHSCTIHAPSKTPERSQKADDASQKKCLT